MKHCRSEKGAAAVEFALVVPVLLALLLGIIDFSRAYNAQITLTQAAREGARTMAVSNDPGLSQSQAIAAAPGIGGGGGLTVEVTPASCTEGSQVTVTVSYAVPSVTGLVGPYNLSGVGVMRCGG